MSHDKHYAAPWPDTMVGAIALCTGRGGAYSVAMSNQPRTTVVLTDPQLAWLRTEAGHLGISVNELIRRIIDKARGV